MQRYYSTIYWHFTGSPIIDWRSIKQPEDILKLGKPKSEGKSVSILKEILKSKLLRATCTEQITETYHTKEFCCTTDIPFKDLLNHAPYYGRAAIGFKANFIQHQFSPVFYVSSENRSFQHNVLENIQLQSNNFSLEFLLNFIKITNFTPKSEEHTFYREKEWRHVGDYHFTEDSIAAIVVPNHYVPDVRKYLLLHHYPEDISVLSWKLIEQA
ncbi:abortive infection system antitoxin AbiGi family protein [Bacillus taeanensis]|uniref:DUF2971 domain-containing protein n=1 Tax=Bacillus taeanensis TaxID=273032 RepID=A0A366XV40_9BACI|nr:abortive infection system antitoxin AbiGi family protein [Bacillus taeanensis]RBW69438.1 hypothetical protein DS031_10970 [Bacillus taeanensis]